MLQSQASGTPQQPAVAETNHEAIEMGELDSPLGTPMQRWSHPHSGAAAVADECLVLLSILLLQRFAQR